MLLFPIRTSISPHRPPYVNYALIVLNIVIFLLALWPPGSQPNEPVGILRPWADQFILTPARPHLWQFISYAFLHGSLLHIFGNMFFLYLFGNNVNDRLGHINYICFYLAGAVFSGVGHTLMSDTPVLGASGAIAAVTGAYLVLFPQTMITVFYWLLVMGTIEWPAMYFILFKLIVWDNMLERHIPNVAYDAHLSGYAFGVVATLLMVAAGLIESSGFDLWMMIKHWNRQRRYRDVVAGGYDPFTGRTQTRRIKVREVEKIDTAADQEIIGQLRNQIAARIAQHNLSAATQIYLELMQLDNSQILPRQYLLDIANQLAGENKHNEAATAYEQFLAHYGTYEYADQVQLMLGILYSRYLDNPDLAIKHLQAAAEKLADPAQLKMCRDELAKLQTRYG